MSKLSILYTLVLTLTIFAGDVATFVNLGFSPDGKFFAFGQYGYYDGSGFPYGEIFIIDVTKNDYVSGGVIKETIEHGEVDDVESISSYQAFLSAHAKAAPILNEKQIIIRRPGIERNAGKDSNTISWKESGKARSATLNLKKHPSDPTDAYGDRASFNIRFTSQGKSFTLGNIKRIRPAVFHYALPKVITSKNGKAVVCIVEKKNFSFEGPDTRFMVETWYQQ